MEELYNLKLHESFTPKEGTAVSIQRVPNGWNYIYYNGGCVFVPYHKEFEPKKEKQPKLFEDLKPKFNAKKFLLDMGVSEQIASDYLVVRRNNKSSNTQTAFETIKKQILLTTHKPDECLKAAIDKGWRGFKADWYFNYKKQNESAIIPESNGLSKFKCLTMEEKQRKHINLNRTYIWSDIDGSDYCGIMTDEEKIQNGLPKENVFTLQGREVK